MIPAPRDPERPGAGDEGFLTGTFGAYRLSLATTEAEVILAQDLRRRAFGLMHRDSDDFDARCRHLLVERRDAGALVCTARLCILDPGDIAQSYSAQFYDLARLARYPGPLLELGRFAIAPGVSDPVVPRLIWAALTRAVDAQGAALLFGCSSFAGCDPAPHAAALAHLGRRHLAPECWRPGRRWPEIRALPRGPGCDATALAAIPPLLRSYLAMGGWVSDHAVIDRKMQTLHVFTGVEVARIPPARVRALRRLAGALQDA